MSLQLFPFSQQPPCYDLCLPGQNQLDLFGGSLPAAGPYLGAPRLISLLRGAAPGSDPPASPHCVSSPSVAPCLPLLCPRLPTLLLSRRLQATEARPTPFAAQAQLLAPRSTQRPQLPSPQAMRFEVTSPPAPLTPLQFPPLIPSDVTSTVRIIFGRVALRAWPPC